MVQNQSVFVATVPVIVPQTSVPFCTLVLAPKFHLIDFSLDFTIPCFWLMQEE